MAEETKIQKKPKLIWKWSPDILTDDKGRQIRERIVVYGEDKEFKRWVGQGETPVNVPGGKANTHFQFAMDGETPEEAFANYDERYAAARKEAIDYVKEQMSQPGIVAPPPGFNLDQLQGGNGGHQPRGGGFPGGRGGLFGG